MKLFTKSVDFATETFPRIPERIQKVLSKEKWMKILRIFGVVFVVLPEKNLGKMEQYIYVHTGMAPPICRLLAFIFIWCYPVIIISLLISFYPLSCVIAIFRNVTNPSIWIETIWNTDIFIGRFFLGALLTTIFSRFIFEIFKLLTRLAVIIDMVSMVKFTLSWIAYIIVYPMYLLLRLLAWITHEPIMILRNVFGYPVTAIFFLIKKSSRYLVESAKFILNWFTSGYEFFMTYFLRYYIYIVALVFAVYMFAVITGRGGSIGLLLSTKILKKAEEKPSNEKQSNENEECINEEKRSDSYEESSNENELSSIEEKSSEIHNLYFYEATPDDWASSITTLDIEDINRIINRMSVDKFYRHAFLEKLRISQSSFVYTRHDPECDVHQASD